MEGSQSIIGKHLAEAEAELAAVEAELTEIAARRSMLEAKRPALKAEIVALREVVAKLTKRSPPLNSLMSDYDVWKAHLDRFGILYEAYHNSLVVFPSEFRRDDYHSLINWETEGGACRDSPYLSVQFGRNGEFRLMQLRGL